MRIIPFIVFHIATYVAGIATGGDVVRTMPGRSMSHVSRRKSGTARSGVSEMPMDDGIIWMINKRDRRSSRGNRIDGFPQSGRNGDFERDPRKGRKRRADREIARRSNYVDEDASSNGVRSPVWQVLATTVTAIGLDSTTSPMIAETGTSDRSSFERQLKDFDHSVNEAVIPVDERIYSNSRGSFDTNENLISSKIANPKSEIEISPFEGPSNKMLLPGMPGDVASPNSSCPRGYQHQKDSSDTYNVKEELSDDRPIGSNERFLLVPVSRNLYVLKNIRDSARVDGAITPKRYEPSGRDQGNGTSASTLSLHMHHDAKDVGGAHLPDRSFDHNANYLNPMHPEETESPTGYPASYPDFLYPGVGFRTRSNLIGTTPETSDGQAVSPLPDYANISLADINSRGGINPSSSAFLSSPSIDIPNLSSPFIDIPNYDVPPRENADDGQPGTVEVDDEVSLSRQDSGDRGGSSGYGEFGIEWTTADFRDAPGTLDDNVYRTPATFDMKYLTDDGIAFNVSGNLGGDLEFSTGGNEPVTDFIDNISTRYRAAIDANEDNALFPNVTCSSVNDAEDASNREDKDSREYGSPISREYDGKTSTYSGDFDYNNRAIDETSPRNNTADVDSFLGEDYVTAASLAPNTDERPLKKAQSGVDNSRALLRAFKPLSSELQKLLSAVKLVNQSLSDVQNRLCDKKNAERENEDGEAANVARLANRVNRDSDLFTESFNGQSLDKRRVKTEDGSVAEPDAKIRREPNGLFLNRLTTPFRKRDAEVQSGRGNFLKKRKSNERKFPKSGNVERRRLSHPRFNRHLKSVTKNYKVRVKPIRPLIAGLKRTKRTTTSIIRSSRLTKSNVSENKFAGGRERNHRRSNQMGRSITSSHNTPSKDMFMKDNSAFRFLSDRRDLQRDAKRAMSSEMSGSDKEKRNPSADEQFHKEVTGYVGVLGLLNKTEESRVEHATDAWTTRNVTESLPLLIFTTTELSVSAFLPYFTEESTITTTIAERKEAPETTASPLYEYVTVADFNEDYDEQNYTKMYEDYEYEEISSKISKIVSLTQSPVSAFTITMPITSSIFYTTELTVLPIDEAAVEIVTEKMTIASPIAIATEVTGIPIAIPTIENFTTESAILLTPFLEGIMDITLKIKIPAATETSIGETPALIKTEAAEEGTVESTSTSLTTEITESLLVETSTTLYAFSTVSLLKTVEAELTIKTTSPIPPTVPVSTTLTKGFRTATTESTFETLYNATAIASSPTVLEETEAILSTSTEMAMTTLTPEDESPVTQIEKPITAEETATEIPTTIETSTEIAITTTETSTTVIGISTSAEATIAEILTINKTLTTASTPTSIETSTVSEIPTIIETTTITETSTPEILTAFKTTFTEETTSAKTLTPTEILTSIKIKTTTETSTTTEISEILTINKTLTTTEIPTSIGTSITSEIPMTSTIPTTVETTTITGTLIPTEILTTLKAPITKETTSVKILTPTEILTSTKIKTTTETSTTTEISEILTINKTLTTTEIPTSIGTSITSEIPMTSTIPTTVETTTVTGTLIPTEILTTLKAPITKETTSVKILTPTEILTSTKIKTTTETSITTETSTSAETTAITEILTITETPTTAETSASAEISITSEVPTTSTMITGTTGISETSNLTEISATTKIPTTTRTTSSRALTPTLTETPSTTVIQMITEIPTTTEIPVISTTYITTKFSTTSESATISSKELFPTSIQTTFTTNVTTETTESTLITSTPATATFVKTTIPTLKLTTTTPLITNTTLSGTPYTAISSTLSTATERSVEITSFKTVVPTSKIKITTTTPLSPATSTTLSETPSTTFSTFLTEETAASSILTTSSLETPPTTAALPISTTESTVETLLTTSSIAIHTTENATVSSTTAGTITAEIFESTISPAMYTVTTPSITEVPITTPVIVDTGTTVYETTSALATSFLLTETTEGTTSSITAYEETKEYEEYYKSTKKEITTASAAELTEEHTTWVAEEVTVGREMTPMTYLPSFTTSLFIGTTTEVTPLETIALPTITEETLMSEKTVAVTPSTIEGTSTLSEVTSISTTPEVTSALPKTVSEEFTMPATERPLVTYATKSPTTSFIETTTQSPTIPAEITEEMLETEYYIAEEPFDGEEYEYEEYDTEIPTDKWYFYEEYETTPMKRTTATTLSEETATSPLFVKGTTSSEVETSEFTRYSTPEIISTNITSTAATSGIPYTEEEVTPAMETSASTVIKNVTEIISTNITSTATTSGIPYTEEEVTPAIETSASTVIKNVTEFTTASEKTESTTRLTFGTTEEYTLPTSTTFRIPTEPLEYLTIPPKERFTGIWPNVTLPKFTTKPEEIPEIALEKTTISEGVSTETEVTKLTSFFVSPALTTLTQRETFEVHTAIMSTASSEATVETGYEVSTMAMTEEETIPHVTPFITSEAETELIFTTSKTVEREKEREELLQRLEDLVEHERKVAEREERLKERERQWDIEKEKRREMMHEKEEAKNVTVATGTTKGYAIITTFITSPVVTISTENLTAPITEIEVASPGLEITASVPTETTPFGITEEITIVTYTTERMEEITTEGSTSTRYTEETEEAAVSYTTEKSTSLTYHTEKTEAQVTDYVTLTPYVTTPIIDLYSSASIETVTPYTVEEMYTTSHVTLYSEPLFASPTITSPITWTTEEFITLPVATFSERFEEASVASTPSWYTTEEAYTEETYADIYSEPLFTSPTLEFIGTTTPSILAIITTAEVRYDEEIERLKEEVRKKERELEEREKILLEREERLERDIMEFEKYMEEFERKKTSQKSTVLTSLSTPVPPTEKATIRAQLTTQIEGVTEKKEYRTTQLTTQIEGVTEKKEYRTTTEKVSSRQTEMKDIEEEKRTQHVSEQTVTQIEEEIATKRICLNVLENSTIPLDKRRDIVTKKICLPYFPEKNEEEKSVGRLSRRLLALQNTRRIRGPGRNVPLDFRCRRKMKETTRKISNLQLSRHEWLSETKPLRHFQGFTRIYRKMRKFPKKVSAVIDTRRNATSEFQDKTSPYDKRAHRENIFQPTETLGSEEHEKRNAFFRYDLISARKNNLPIDDRGNVRKRDVSPTGNDARFFSRKSTVNTSSRRPTMNEEDGFYTVNVLHLNYNKDEQVHEVISAKPDEAELTAILSDSNGDNDVIKFGEDGKITTPYYNIEEEEEMAETEKKVEEDEEYVEDTMDNYMNYKELETSTHGRGFLNDGGKDKRMSEDERKLLDRAWPTEKNTAYHLGGTRYWELDFVTEPSAVSRTTIDKGKTADVSITRTTCFDVVLKNERSEARSNTPYHKRDVYGNGKNVSIEKRNASLRNVTRKRASRRKLERPVERKLKRDSQKSNYTKRSFEARGTAGFNDFRRAGDEDSITARSRKPHGVNASKPRRQIVKQTNATGKRSEKQSAKSRASQKNVNLRSVHNCLANKKNKYRKATTSSRIRKTDDEKFGGKVTHLDTVDRKSGSTSHAPHGRKIHSCFNCICDIANVVNGVRSLLSGPSFPPDEIQALRCSEYKEIQDKMVISMDSDVEEAREFPQPHYNVESLKGQRYIRLEELEDNFKSDSELDSDHDVVSLPGLNLNLPCNRKGDITWLSSVSRPSYAWRRTDGLALLGFVAENGDLELRNVNAKDTGNYTCVMTYTSPDSEEPVETAYEINLQVVTLPRYVVHGEGRYHARSCDERDLDVLVTYLPLKLNSVVCEADVCNAYVLTPSCSRSQITVNVLLVPSHIVKLMKIDPQRCNVFCLKAIQNKLSLILSTNLQIFLEKTIIFRLPHYEQRLVPIAEGSSFARRKRGKTDASAGRSSSVGLFSSCPAGYGLRGARCVPCNMGTYSEDGTSRCKRCPPGTYQPNHGARVCRTCTNPMTKGCYNMLWNSFSAVMVTLASVGAMLSICLLLLWIICCAKKKFCVKRMAGIVAGVDAFEPEKRAEGQSLIKDTSENEDQQWDREYRVKKKKGKFYVNKRRRKQNESGKYDKTHAHEDEWGSHRTKNAPIICRDSYRSHEECNYRPKQSYRKGPRLPEYDFDT